MRNAAWRSCVAGLSAEAKASEAGHGRPCRRSCARAGLEEHIAQARGFFLGETALFVGIDGGRRHDGRRDRLTPVLRVEDRTAEVPGKAGPRTGPL
ncbi:MAG: hypothetical protein AcusKO_45110 [Acuticoccus sp.]